MAKLGFGLAVWGRGADEAASKSKAVFLWNANRV